MNYLRSIPPVTMRNVSKGRVRFVSKPMVTHTPRKVLRVKTEFSPKVECLSEIVENLSSNGDLGVILRFTALAIPDGLLNQDRTEDPEIRSVQTPIFQGSHRGVLTITARKGLVEVDAKPVCHNVLKVDQLISEYSPSGMVAMCKNGIIILRFGRKNG